MTGEGGGRGVGKASGKSWDDPTLTEEEFVKDVRAANPRRKIEDADLRTAYRKGQRRSPDGTLRTPPPRFIRTGKAWDDKTLTPDESIQDYRATAKTAAKDQPTDAQLRQRYDQDLRWDPATSKWRSVGTKPRDW